ncbi:CaiB/BaiF CoA transferase family protein [Pseudorhodoplanes sp.]|uniref:CaiB/BaiF CoA transferase family protein n=1 Tax=Pseudorhodoplanes sp. TaxID=1934341 RepID=UPI003D13051A
MIRPLDGCLVLDFSTLLPGPIATLLLVEAGAEVIKIERRDGGDDMRHYDPKWGDDSVNFALLNRGKKSVALNLKDPKDLEKLYPLIRRADVLVEQFRPGVMSRLGLGYLEVSALNPKLIYCSITGYGQDGPKRATAGHDLNYLGDTGLLALSMGGAKNPVVPPALIGDIAGGSYPAVINILLALEARRKTGKGCLIDIAMADNLFTFMYWALGNGVAADRWPGNGTDLATGGSPRYRLYGTQDGKVLAAAPMEQKFWEIFCDIIELENEFRDDQKNPQATIRRISEIIRSQSAQVWSSKFVGTDCCCSIVVDIRAAMRDPHFVSRRLFDYRVTNRALSAIPALPVPVDPNFRGSATDELQAPSLGEHNDAILGSALKL